MRLPTSAYSFMPCATTRVGWASSWEACADYAAQYPDIMSWRLALALAHVHNGALADARSEFEVAAGGGL